jgi:hypothetical protein
LADFGQLTAPFQVWWFCACWPIILPTIKAFVKPVLALKADFCTDANSLLTKIVLNPYYPFVVASILAV